MDPIGLAGGDTNIRRYVGNNPVTTVDPSGFGIGFAPINGKAQPALTPEQQRAIDLQQERQDILRATQQAQQELQEAQQEQARRQKNDQYEAENFRLYMRMLDIQDEIERIRKPGRAGKIPPPPPPPPHAVFCTKNPKPQAPQMRSAFTAMPDAAPD
jgi:hypothetical protein